MTAIGVPPCGGSTVVGAAAVTRPLEVNRGSLHLNVAPVGGAMQDDRLTMDDWLSMIWRVPLAFAAPRGRIHLIQLPAGVITRIER